MSEMKHMDMISMTCRAWNTCERTGMDMGSIWGMHGNTWWGTHHLYGVAPPIATRDGWNLHGTRRGIREPCVYIMGTETWRGRGTWHGIACIHTYDIMA